MLDDEDPYVGRMLSGRYQLRSKLKGGSACRVYGAFDMRLNADVIVKFGDPAVDSESHMRRFQREGVALCCVRHERIVRLLDWDIDASGIEFLVLERVEGETLREYLCTARTVIPRWAILIAASALEALAAVHAAGLLHRDVKPGNIIVSLNGLTLIDFNLVIPLPSARADRTWKRITMPGTCIGTPGYFPPERIRDAPADVRDDIYAMGLVLYEMLVGRRPHEMLMGPFSTLDPNWFPPPAAFSKFASENVPQALQDVTLRALERTPEKRFASAQDMRQALLDLKP